MHNNVNSNTKNNASSQNLSVKEIKEQEETIAVIMSEILEVRERLFSIVQKNSIKG